MKKLLFLLVLVIVPWHHGYCIDREIKNSVVKIFSVLKNYNYSEPWQMRGQINATGSGCIISDQRIITNAHVVRNHSFIQVKKANEAQKYVAEVIAVAHECDLALLRVEDKTFFKGTKPIAIGRLPKIRDKVAVYGFPVGGEEISITEGVVSRIDHVHYAHSGEFLLSCQIDAAINPGNSGGPVIKNKKIIGVAFQILRSGDNVGYMVPVPLVKRFLKDISDGTYNGIPALGVSLQTMENDALRKKHTMKDTQAGVLVNKVVYGSPASTVLEPNDVIHGFDEYRIENDGTVEFRTEERTDLNFVLQKKYVGGTIDVIFLRDGTRMEKSVTLTQGMDAMRLVPHLQFDIPPTYFIVGGLVFEPLTQSLLEEFGGNWRHTAPKNLLNYYYYGEKSDDIKEIVVLKKILADSVNIGYHHLSNLAIEKVNGTIISDLPQLITLVENNTGPYLSFVDTNGQQIVLDRSMVEERNDEILSNYQISHDRSEDLKTP
ncbi:MAG: trypsin-like serine protease [Elusimicrobia bacterium]|nr:trypsin-like serine protease [Elusimicrobiota bacterium]MBD3412194.1 trypsin-like serine protease [Elusimicrobiota bacterium]